MHRAVNACITPVCAMDGCHVVTVEGIGSVKKGLHPVQKELSDRWMFVSFVLVYFVCAPFVPFCHYDRIAVLLCFVLFCTIVRGVCAVCGFGNVPGTLFWIDREKER